MELKDKIKIWQQNVNKSPICQHDLLSGGKLSDMNIDVIALQEPAINAFNHNLTIAARNWSTIYPTTHNAAPNKTRSIILVSAQISTDTWNQLDFPSGDVTVIQIKGSWGKLTIFNIYNEGNSNVTINALTKYYKDNRDNMERGTEPGKSAHILWVGDFNRHHPYWDDPNDTRLFTNEATKEAETLIEAVAEVGLELALPSGTPTHCHNVTKKWSRLDQVFISEHSVNMLTACDTLTEHMGIKTDHLPILTELNLSVSITEDSPAPNYREVDWEAFRKELGKVLDNTQPAERIDNQRQLDRSCGNLTKAIQNVIQTQVPVAKISPKTKRWWTKELTQLRRHAEKLGRQAYRQRACLDHVIHAERKEAAKKYAKVLQHTKRQHWRDWLEKADEPDIWTANRIISAPATDGGKARIPILKRQLETQETAAYTNNEKAEALAECFFPPKPQEDNSQTERKYPRQCRGNIKITAEQIQNQTRKLKPYKAPGPDGIPNIVLTKCADMLIDRLLPIFEAMFERGLMYKPWKTFTTVVLRKPGKPRYDVPKAYRPIALLNTMWKVLTAIVAEQLTYVSEKYHLLPDNHFGGRPGRTTTDAMHLLTNTIKQSWRAGKVTAVLFLDIEGAFPNAVPPQLEHNMRKRGVPKKIVGFIHNMLRGRETSLKFDGYTSDPIKIDNGIGQGDPLSMVMYQFYNADLLDIPKEEGESAIAYVDDTLMLATANNFQEAHDKLASMMSREGGVAEWSTSHNSRLEYSKLALIDFAHRSSTAERTPLQLPQREVQPTESAKYLGVIFDQNLNWKAQHAHAVGKGTSWATQIKRLTRPTWGITPKYARKLYISVAIPRTLYALDIWCAPVGATDTEAKRTPKVIKQLTSIQRIGALAVTGGLRSSPTDALDANAFLLPLSLTVNNWHHRAAVRLAMLPSDHPLHRIANRKTTGKIKRHKSPINSLLGAYAYDPKRLEKIPSTARDPMQSGKLPFKINIAETRENSMREDEEANEEVQVYTDGSAINGKVGAAAILIREGNAPRTLHLHLGPESEHTVHEAELVGIILGMHLISTEKHGSTTFAIGVDNQAAIKAFQSTLRNPGHHLAREALRIANQIQKRRSKARYSLTIRWTAGHEGIEGNEAADVEAKAAAEGKTTDKPLLPSYLRKRLPINPAAVKRAHHDKQKKTWIKEWRSSKRGIACTRIDSSTPSKKFLSSISQNELSRDAASRIGQFRLAHSPVNQYLKRIGKVDSARCPACGADEETIRHFLIQCPSYAHERWALAKQASKQRKQVTMEALLGTPELAIPLANYIDATKRFSNIDTKEQ